MLVVMDRIEGQFAVMEFPDRSIKDVPLNLLPEDAKPGDCFWFKEGQYVPSPEETDRRRIEIARLAQSMWKD